MSIQSDAEFVERAKKLATRSGAKSTEFWAVIASSVVGVLVSLKWITPEHWAAQLITLVVPIAGTLIYAAIRGSLKKEALRVLGELVKQLQEREGGGRKNGD